MASIRTRPRADGTFTYSVLWRENGNGTQTSETFDELDKAELLRDYLNANGQSFALADRAIQQSRAHGPTLAEAAERHIKRLTGIEDRTRADYRRDVRLHILPHLGNIRAQQLSTESVAAWINKLEDDGCSPKSIANYHGLLSAIMTTYAAQPDTRDDNPCKGLRLPSRDRTRDRDKFLEVDEYELLLAQIPPQWQPLVRTLAGTGARWSEITALNVSDLLHGKPAAVQITKAWKRDDHNGYRIGNPKTRNAVRDVTVSKALGKELTALAAARGHDEPLLPSPTGRHISYHYFQGKVWAPAVKRAQKAGLRKKPKIKSLRHSHGSWLAAAGVDLPTISRRLGHESIQTTVNIYGHISQRAQSRAAKTLGKLLR